MNPSRRQRGLPCPRLRRLTAVCVLATLSPQLARAQQAGAPSASATTDTTQPSNVAEAERLFREATLHMDARDYAAACPMLEQSHALDPSSGTLLNLGDCYEQLGRTASAWRAFRDARDLSMETNRHDRAQIAEIRMTRLAKMLHFVKVIPPRRQIDDLVIRLDDEPLPASSWAIAVPVDPGAHVLTASAPGHREYRVPIAEGPPGETTTLEIPQLEPLPSPAQPLETGSDANALDSQGVAAIACGAVGVLGLVGGTVFGLRSMSKRDAADDYCTGRVCSSQRGVDLKNEAHAAGTLSTVSFIVGGVGLGAAAVLWFVRPFGDEGVNSVEVGLGPSALSVRGSF